ncbi:hypothetical protein JCM10213_009267 [Rhodosporidiobolus nylandii]
MDESPLAFIDRWTASLRSLQAAVEAKSIPASEASEAAQQLSQQLTARTGDLPLSEQGRCERELKALQDSLAALKTAAAPRAKFSFKRSAPSSTKPKPEPARPRPAPLTSSTPPPRPAVSSPATSAIPPNSLTLSSRSSSYLSCADLPPTSSDSSGEGALALTSLTGCFVDLVPSSVSVVPTDATKPFFSALYLSQLEDCVVLLPVTSHGSILIQSCVRCLLVLGGHQFRMHDSTECKIFLAAGSTPIIERCRGLVFGRYPSLLSPEATHKLPAAVQDFDDPFATPERPSSNWRLASAEEEEQVWGVGDGQWKDAAGRKEGWQELLEASVRQQ